MMLNAREAYIDTVRSINEAKSVDLTDISEKIKEARENRKFQIKYFKRLNDPTIKELCKLGYLVEWGYDQRCGESWIVVSWDGRKDDGIGQSYNKKFGIPYTPWDK